MIRILHEGSKENNKTFIRETTCNNCGCRFEYTLGDCESVEGSRERRNEVNLEIRCPRCGHYLHRILK